MLPGLGDEANELANVLPLRRLLSAATVALLVGSSAFLLWDLSSGAGRGDALLFLLVLVFGAAAVALLTGPDYSTRELRIIERVVFAALTGYLAWTAYATLGDVLAAGDTQALAARWDLTVVQFVLLAVAYGTVVPNAWPRAARVIGGMVLTPVAVVVLLWLSSPERATGLRRVATPGWVAQSLIALAIAAAVGILAAHVIDQYLGLAQTTRISIRYVLERRIGQGGMGEVWLAEHNLLARPAAVKLVRAESVRRKSPDKADILLRRFEREARATARLRSVHTVEVYDSGVTDDGTFYYAMELLDGIGLDRLVEEYGVVPAGRVVYLLEQACQSLAEAHDHGMTHRDVKPANIYTCRLGTDRDFVKVLDFGLVTIGTLAAGRLEEATDLTLDDEINGTPAYMAPELIHRTEIEPDGRADLYALGCVGYYLLTGAPVFDGPPLSVLVDHVKTAPEPPSSRTEVEIPAALEKVILRCLEKDPADRYQSAGELAEALVACRPEPGWDAEQADEWWRLHLPEPVV